MTGASSGTSSPVVLVIDDHEIFSKSLCFVLRDRGYDTHVADPESIASILYSASETPVGLAVLDLHLGRGPDHRLIDPVTLTHSLHGSGWTVLAVTACDDDETAAAVIAAGAIGLVEKASPLAEMLAAVRAGTTGEPLMTGEERSAWLARDYDYREQRAALNELFDRLDAGEMEVLRLIGQGTYAAGIAKRLDEPLATVRARIRGILRKLECTSQLEAVALSRKLSEWP